MADFLMRQDAPLNETEWNHLDQIVIQVARQLLVGRRVIELTGPVGIGTQVVPLFTVGRENDTAQVTRRDFVPLTLVEQDFVLSWHDIEIAQQQGFAIELGPAAAAAAACARTEDELILHGLLHAPGHKSVPLKDWNQDGAALENIVAATESLVSDGFFGPFAVILSPALYAQTQRVDRSMGRLVAKLIGDVAEGGLFRSPLLQANQGIVLSQGKHNLDLVIGQDLIAAYLGPEAMNHRFRLLENLALRIKRPGAICVLGD